MPIPASVPGYPRVDRRRPAHALQRDCFVSTGLLPQNLGHRLQLVGLAAKGLEPNQTKRWLEEKRTKLKLGETLI